MKWQGYLKIIIGEQEEGCEALVDAIYFNSNSANLYAEIKTGKFTLQILGDSQIYNFERRENIQYETYEGQTYSGKISWLKNGDYTIIPTDESEIVLSQNPKFIARILKINENEYLYRKIEENQVQFGRVNKID